MRGGVFSADIAVQRGAATPLERRAEHGRPRPGPRGHPRASRRPSIPRAGGPLIVALAHRESSARSSGTSLARRATLEILPVHLYCRTAARARPRRFLIRARPGGPCRAGLHRREQSARPPTTKPVFGMSASATSCCRGPRAWSQTSSRLGHRGANHPVTPNRNWPESYHEDSTGRPPAVAGTPGEVIKSGPRRRSAHSREPLRQHDPGSSALSMSPAGASSTTPRRTGPNDVDIRLPWGGTGRSRQGRRAGATAPGSCCRRGSRG